MENDLSGENAESTVVLLLLRLVLSLKLAR